MRSPDPERETMPIAGGAGEAPVSNAWWRGWKRRPHRQHERTPAWSLYRRGHRSPASAIRADRDGADYPRRDRRAEIAERRRADRTTAQAPARSWSKARFGPSIAHRILVRSTRLEKLRIPFQAYHRRSLRGGRMDFGVAGCPRA